MGVVGWSLVVARLAQQIGCVPWRCGGVHATSSTGAGGEGEMGIRMYNGAFWCFCTPKRWIAHMVDSTEERDA